MNNPLPPLKMPGQISQKGNPINKLKHDRDHRRSAPSHLESHSNGNRLFFLKFFLKCFLKFKFFLFFFKF